MDLTIKFTPYYSRISRHADVATNLLEVARDISRIRVIWYIYFVIAYYITVTDRLTRNEMILRWKKSLPTRYICLFVCVRILSSPCIFQHLHPHEIVG